MENEIKIYLYVVIGLLLIGIYFVCQNIVEEPNLRELMIENNVEVACNGSKLTHSTFLYDKKIDVKVGDTEGVEGCVFCQGFNIMKYNEKVVDLSCLFLGFMEKQFYLERLNETQGGSELKELSIR